MDKLNTIEKSILKTIIYFDLFIFPLTKIELYKNLYSLENKISFQDFLNILENSNQLKNIISEKEGFYFLKNKENIVRERKEKYIISYKKYILAKRFIKILSLFKSFKFIGVCSNSLVLDNAKDDSDIDLFIITKENRVWTARLISVLIAKILNLRPKENNKKNKMCLSFYVDEKKMNMERFSDNNIYFIYWVSQIIPIYDEGDYSIRFFKENIWIKETLKNIFEFNTGYKRKINNTKKIINIRNILNYFSSDFLENIFKKIQLKTFNKEIKNKLNINDDVFCDDYIIKLHTKDRREEYKNKFEIELKKYEEFFQ